MQQHRLSSDEVFARWVLALVAVVVAALILVVVLDHIQLSGACNPGPRPPAWTVAQYHRYLLTACQGGPR